ncbi:effector binding domain-containing protein [soil metagenome]
MKIIKYLFFLLLIAIIAGAIYIATKDGDYHIEETKIVHAPVPVVFNEVNNYYNWESWGPWRNESDDIIVQYNPEIRGEGGGFSWKSNELGDGTIATTKVLIDNSLEQVVVHNPSFAESRGKMYWKFEEVDEGTKVTLGMSGSQSFKEKLAYAFKDNSLSQMLKPRFARTLEKLNSGLLNKMSVYSINVDGVTTHGGGFYMYTTTASKISQVPIRMKNMLTQVRNYMELNNITIQGDPFVLYNSWDEQNDSAIYSTGIFTPSIVITPSDSDVLNGLQPNQQVVKTTLKGDHENLKEAWDRAYQYIEENNLMVDDESQPFEVYKTDPDSTMNPANWVTEIFIPVTSAPVFEME